MRHPFGTRRSAGGGFTRCWAGIAGLIALFVARTAAAGPELTAIDAANVEAGIAFLTENGYGQAADQVEALYALGAIRAADLPGATNAETVDGIITLNRDRLAALPRDRATLPYFERASFMAQLLLHELVHAGQTSTEITLGNLQTLIGDNPPEQAGWGAAMQATLNWIAARERQIPGGNAATKRRLAEQIKSLAAGLDKYYDDLETQGHGAVVLRDSRGRLLDEPNARRYAAAATTQANQILAGREPQLVPGTETALDRAVAEKKWRDRLEAIRSDERRLSKTMSDLLGRTAYGGARSAAFESYYLLESSVAACLAVENVCLDTRGHHAEVQRLARAARGAADALDHELSGAREYVCSSELALEAVRASYEKGKRNAADALQLVGRAGEALEKLAALHKRAAAQDVVISPAFMTTIAEGARKLCASEMRPRLRQLQAETAKMQPLVDQALALRRKRDEWMAGLEAEYAATKDAGLGLLIEYAPELEPWPITPAIKDEAVHDLRELQRDVQNAERTLDKLSIPERCGDLALAEKALEQAKAEVDSSQLQLLAFDELRRQCEDALGMPSFEAIEEMEGGLFQDSATPAACETVCEEPQQVCGQVEVCESQAWSRDGRHGMCRNGNWNPSLCYMEQSCRNENRCRTVEGSCREVCPP